MKDVLCYCDTCREPYVIRVRDDYCMGCFLDDYKKKQKPWKRFSFHCLLFLSISLIGGRIMGSEAQLIASIGFSIGLIWETILNFIEKYI